MQKLTTFLMFSGQAEEAMNFYASLFPNSAVTSLVRFGPGEAGPEGSVKHAIFTLDGQEFMAIDSSVEQSFTFTAAMPIFVNCDGLDELLNLYQSLSAGGQTFMPLDDYSSGDPFAWVEDRFGVSWQLMYAEESGQE